MLAKRINNGLLLLVLSISCLSIASDPKRQAVPSQQPGKVSFWLKKMQQALHMTSYNGTFIYARGRLLESVKVAHHIEDGIEFEKLTSLNGEKREIIRRGNQVICYHDGTRAFNQSHPIPLGPFSHSFTESINDNQSLYQIALHGKSRVADRVAIQMRITPKNNDRYSYILWLDEASGLLLRSSLMSRRGQVLELFQFSDVHIGETIAPALLASTLPANSPGHSLSDPMPAPTAANSRSARRNSHRVQRLREPWVPAGFRRVRSRTANNLQFSDGIATLTIFIEKADKNGLGNIQTSIGGTVLISREIKGTTKQITLVGEIPLTTAQKIAESIKPVIY